MAGRMTAIAATISIAHWRQALQIDDGGQKRNKEDHRLWIAQRFQGEYPS
jgi:hypothetical protein